MYANDIILYYKIIKLYFIQDRYSQNLHLVVLEYKVNMFSNELLVKSSFSVYTSSMQSQNETEIYSLFFSFSVITFWTVHSHRKLHEAGP